MNGFSSCVLQDETAPSVSMLSVDVTISTPLAGNVLGFFLINAQPHKKFQIRRLLLHNLVFMQDMLHDETGFIFLSMVTF